MINQAAAASVMNKTGDMSMTSPRVSSKLWRTIMVVAYVLAALEAITLLGLFLSVAFAPHQASDSGGQAMALFFFVVVPSCILAIAIGLLVFGRRSVIASSLAIAIIAAPGAGLVWWAVDTIRLDRAVAELTAGRGYFEGRDARALGEAIVAHDLPTVARLAELTNVNQKGSSGMTFLQLALEKPDVDLPIVQTLLKAGADPNDDQARSVGIAIYYGSTALLAQLLVAGADPNTTNMYGTPVFFRAGRQPHLIPQLLAGGAHIEATGSGGRTMLLDAITDENWAAVDMLLDQGANRDVADRDGKGAIDLLREQRRKIEDNGRSIEPGLIALESRFRERR